MGDNATAKGSGVFRGAEKIGVDPGEREEYQVVDVSNPD